MSIGRTKSIQLLESLIKGDKARNRSSHLLEFINEWYMFVPEWFHEALDTKELPPAKNNKKRYTQGINFSFKRGDTLYSDECGYLPWPKGLIDLKECVIVKEASPAKGRRDLGSVSFQRYKPDYETCSLIELGNGPLFGTQIDFVRFLISGPPEQEHDKIRIEDRFNHTQISTLLSKIADEKPEPSYLKGSFEEDTSVGDTTVELFESDDTIPAPQVDEFAAELRFDNMWRNLKLGVNSHLSLPIYITYINSKNEAKEREVALNKILRNRSGELNFDGFCKKRKRYLTFKVKRIAKLIDMRTGQIFYDSTEYFEPLMLFDTIERQKLQIQIHILKYLYLAGHDFDSLGKKFLISMLSRHFQFDKLQLVQDYIENVQVYKQNYLELTKLIQFFSKTEVTELIANAKKLIEKDGVVTQSEKELFDMLL